MTNWHKHSSQPDKKPFSSRTITAKGKFAALAAKSGAYYTSKSISKIARGGEENEDGGNPKPKFYPKKLKLEALADAKIKRDNRKNGSLSERSSSQNAPASKSSKAPSSKKSNAKKARKTARQAARKKQAAIARKAAMSAAVKAKAAIAAKTVIAAASPVAIVVGLLLLVLMVMVMVVGVIGYNESLPKTASLSENEAQVASYLIGKDLDTTHVAAVMGNIEAESGFNPAAEEFGGGGRGLCQWTGGRFIQLMQFSVSEGKPWQDLGLQLDFLWAEMTGEGSAAAFNGVQYNHQGFLNTDTLENAVMYFGRNFERPNEQYANWDRRTASAQRYLAALTGSVASTSGVVNSAMSKIGCPYVFGSAGSDTFDCSGLVVWSYNQNGINNIRRTTYDQYKQCAIIPKEQAVPGDLIFMIFSSPGVPEHVGIYIGDGQMVHAPTFGAYVRTDSAGWVYADAVYARYLGD